METAVTVDRLVGVLIGAACADALGAGYEFGSPMPPDHPVSMRGQGPFLPGEWTDDTAQLLAIALAAADGADLRTVAELKESRQPGSSGGNGALMRTAGVAMALYSDPTAMVRAAMRLASLTHADELSSQACAVWCLAIRAALLAEDPSNVPALATSVAEDLRTYLPSNATYWHTVLDESYGTSPVAYYGHVPANGYCVTTVRAAWAAVTSTPIPDERPGRHLALAIEAAVRGGGDTDTVACVAGALVGAMWGYSAVPLRWRRRIFGWPNMRDADLVRIGYALQQGGPDSSRWPHAQHQPYPSEERTDALAIHPHDDGVVLSGVDAAYGRLPIPGGPIGAVVSLCRVGATDLDHFGLSPGDRIAVPLIDAGHRQNPHLQLVVDEAADAVAAYRAEGKRVLLHCVAAQSRTPSVAARYSVRHRGINPGSALREVCQQLPYSTPNPALAAAVAATDG